MANEAADLDLDNRNIRLCHIIKWDDFDGYGFNLHAEKGRPGQYVGKVDHGSPAEAAGLREGDRIVEVNGVNISNENHKQVVQRIKTIANETKLLVVDPETDSYLQSKNIVLKSSLPNITYLKSPDTRDEYVRSSSGLDKPDIVPQNAAVVRVGNGDCELKTSYSARLCHIVKWDNFDGYGFNLHAERGRAGQYIGKVDEGSPAEAAGLKEGDRIIEVNGINIVNENHKQVVQRIRTSEKETKLLVVDVKSDTFFKAKSILVNSASPGVLYMKTPVLRPMMDEKPFTRNGTDTISDDSQSNSSTRSIVYSEQEAMEKTCYSSPATPSPSSERKTNHVSSSSSLEQTSTEIIAEHYNNGATRGEGGGCSAENIAAHIGGKLNLNMTAKELRAQLAARKKYDPKKESLDIKKKYEIVQKL